jgi:hypothetical protein
LARGYWRRLPFRQRLLGLYTLTMPCLLALGWVLIPVAILTAVAVKAPVLATLFSFLPALPMLAVLAVEIAALGEFGRTFGAPPRARDYARLAVGLPFYHALLAFSAARAVAREARGSRDWEKTAHFGLHFLSQPREGREGDSGPIAGAALPAQRGPLAIAATAAEAVPLGGTAFADDEGSPGEEAIRALAAARVAVRQSAPIALGGGHGATRAGGRAPAIGTVRASGTADPADGNGGAPQRRAAQPESDTAGTEPAAPPATPPRRRRLRGVVRAHPDATIQLLLLTGVALVQGTNMAHWPGPAFDEGTYVGNAWAVQAHGALSNYTYGYGHPPLGWLTLSLWAWAHGLIEHAIASVDVSRELMLVVSLVSCSLLYTLARRLGIRRPLAAGAVILFTCSPLALWFHRLVLLDNFAVAWSLAAFVLVLSPRHRLWAFAGSGACYAAALLSKETAIVFLPALVFAAVQSADRRTRRYTLTVSASCAVLIAAAYPLYAVLKGELLPGKGHVSLVGEEFTQLVTRQASGSVFGAYTRAHGTVQLWLHLDPWLLLAAWLACPIAYARRTSRPVAFCFLLQVVFLLRPGYLPQMYVIGLLPFGALTVAASAEVLWRFGFEPPPWPAGAGRGLWRWIATQRSIIVTCVALVIASVFAVVVEPSWARADRQALVARPDASQRAAEDWLVRNVDHTKRLIVDDNIWVYLIGHGFDASPVRGGFYSRTVVFYWPLDYDPAVKRQFPDGWRDFDYVVSTEGMRNDTSQTPSAGAAIKDSRVVASFGQGAQLVEIRKIVPAPQPPSGTVKQP